MDVILTRLWYFQP